MLSYPTVRILIHHAGPQVLDELNVRLVNDIRVLSKEVLGNDDSKLFDRGKVVSTG